MRQASRWFSFGTILASGIALATAATAQSKRHDKKTPKPETSSDNPYGEGDTPAKTSDASTSDKPSSPDPATASVGDAGVRLSPLTPPPAEFAATDAGPPVDYDRVLSDLAALRARTSAIAANLFRSRMVVNVASEASHAKVTRLVLSLDDGVVYTSATAPARGESSTLLSRALAPGKHAVTVEVERKDDRNEAFRNSQRSRFVVEVRKDEELRVDLKLLDDSDMGGDFPSDGSGEYDLRVKMRAESRPAKK